MSLLSPKSSPLPSARALRPQNGLARAGRKILLATALAAAGASCGKGNLRKVQFSDAAVHPDAAQVFPDAAAADAGFHDSGARTSTTPDAGPPPPPDRDRDGVPDDRDNCPGTSNADQSDTDRDGAGDLCDLCPGVAVAGGRHGNVDGDRFGDECDGCPVTADDGRDDDRDGVPNACDNAPRNYNLNQTDADLDGVADVIDNCRLPNPGQVDNDGDGRGVPCDCNDNNPTVYPGAPDAPCDKVDSDCDGIGRGVTSVNSTIIVQGEPLCQCEPGMTRQVGINQGECRPATETCYALSSGDEGHVVTRYRVTTPGRGPSAEVCDANMPPHDEDCDGLANEQGGPNGGPCECVPGQTRACGNATPPCREGLQSCEQVAGQNVFRWGGCVGAVGPASAIDFCNGVNDDCQGGVDDGFRVGNLCTGSGLCGVVQGSIECASLTTTRCSTNPGGTQSRASEELCDGRGADEDCDRESNEEPWPISEAERVGRERGRVGEPCTHNPAGPGTLECLGLRSLQCSSVRARTHAPHIPEGSVAGECDGSDNDFDGMVDEGCQCSPTSQPVACGTNEGACNQGRLPCVNGVLGTTCGGPGFIGPTTETYNGEDDNCNRIVDDGPQGVIGRACRGVGACGNGLLEVRTATSAVCSTMPGGSNSQANAEVINGVDDNCDGRVDDPRNGRAWPGTGGQLGDGCIVPGICGAGVVVGDGANATRTVCSSESRRTHNPALLETTIAGQCGNGVDDDCDGANDDGCTCNAGATRPCGTGSCMNGIQTCDANGRTWGTCVGATVPTRELCGDGINSDCDPMNLDSNGYALNTPCNGVGVCGAGVLECAGVGSTTTRCSTNPGGSANQSRPERCNDRDDDCDGPVDEDFNVGAICVVPRRCGPLNGEVRCQDTVNTYCHTNSSTVAEVPGNGIDDNCNGSLTR